MEKGVLQGDCFSPLKFNLIINTCIQSVKHGQYEQFVYKFIRYLTLCDYNQYPDDAAALSDLESENQILLNLFSRWCSWADMITRVDKSNSFGIRASGTSSKQFQPKLSVNNELVPPVRQDEYFTYLGRHFDYKMTNNQHKGDLLSDTNDMMKIIVNLPLHPKNKMLIYQRYVLSKSGCNLTIADIDITWVKQSHDSIVNQYSRYYSIV